MHLSTSLRVPPLTSTIIPPPSSHATAFSRPAYLENSALRHCLLSEPAPAAPPAPYLLGTLHASAAATSSRAGSSSPTARDTGDSDEDSNAGERGRTTTPSLPRQPVETYMYLPTRWSETDRCPSLSVSVDGRELTFHGANFSGEREAASARTNYPIPPACGIYYYEIEVLNKGQKGRVRVLLSRFYEAHHGIFGLGNVRLGRLPGWEGKSWGYHGDDGNSFASETEGSAYGPKFSTGDTVGCGIDFGTGRAFFTKNGRYLGDVFENLGSAGDLYPTVGLRTSNEAIRANFGHEPFMYDIETRASEARNKAWAQIQSTPIAWTSGAFTKEPEAGEGDEVKKPLNELILGYLAHHGYANTANAFRKQAERRAVGNVGTTTPMTMDTDGEFAAASFSNASHSSSLGPDATLIQNDTVKRQRIVHAITAGDIDTALDETKRCYPSVLEREGGIIMFKLRCRKFIELVLEAAAAWRVMREQGANEKGKETANGANMDVDDDSNHTNGASVRNGSSKSRTKSSASSVAPSFSQIALERAIMNGQSLQADYKSDARLEVQAIYKRALSLVAYDDPLADDPRVPQSVKEIAGQTARDALAEEVNRAILESQGRPPHPPLERLYRHTQASIVQLGWLGVGAAAFADMPKEFMDA
ncbi:concanavalin A-like lectin/glucanase domain-containing protein [Hysterangium stoloniferum]|nr:concanavalin A-like lectin/glucanase domain-containing protein [Hysterangium stoloniferum]